MPIPKMNSAEQPRCLLQLEAAILQALGKLTWCLAKASHIKEADTCRLVSGKSFIPGFTPAINNFCQVLGS